jgi:hypothetical protein
VRFQISPSPLGAIVRLGDEQFVFCCLGADVRTVTLAVRVGGGGARMVALPDREPADDDQDRDERGEQGDATLGKSAGPPMLTDVVAFEVVFRDAVHRRREVGDRGTEPAVA